MTSVDMSKSRRDFFMSPFKQQKLFMSSRKKSSVVKAYGSFGKAISRKKMKNDFCLSLCVNCGKKLYQVSTRLMSNKTIFALQIIILNKYYFYSYFFCHFRHKQLNLQLWSVFIICV
jgi:hypothetical protein